MADRTDEWTLADAVAELKRITDYLEQLATEYEPEDDDA